ncbi:MAG: hypothetical protein IPL84_01795 [Chitinophagaceae bacterium]|nr:hypothetical protein [Chitinophagaceae bacterium]
MDKLFQKFYRTFYMKTGGFMPTQPAGQLFFPGDFFQIRNGNIIVLGNIFRGGLVNREDVVFKYGISQNPAGWQFSENVKKANSGRMMGEGAAGNDFEYSKLLLSFDEYGAFIFKGNQPTAVKIMNWVDLQQQLIIKLTQTVYSFRELYLVTETATTSDWTLAIGGSNSGELEIATDVQNYGLVDIFGHESAKTIQSKDIEYYHREDKPKPVFFKAKKLQVQDDQVHPFISSLISERQGRPGWATDFFEYDFFMDIDNSVEIPFTEHAILLDMLQANELNPNTALLYFKWGDANLEDLNKLFLNYG